jgi:uncharacterized protein YjdB
MLIARRPLAVIIALLLSGCSDINEPTVNRVAFDRHAATLLAGDVLATSVSVSRTDGVVVAKPMVVFASSNALVASVDSTGKVYAHVAGQATITAAVGSVRDELNLTVLWPPVTTVVFRDDSLVRSVGDAFTTLVWVINSKGNYATNAPLTYSSSAPSIATVDGGNPSGCPVATCNFEPRIAAVGEGRATITVTAEHISDSLVVIVTRR